MYLNRCIHAASASTSLLQRVAPPAITAIGRFGTRTRRPRGLLPLETTQIRNLSGNSTPRSNPGPPSRSSNPRQRPTMAQLRAPFRHGNRSILYYTLSAIMATVALSYGSVPLYKMLCAEIGWGGQPVKAPTHGGTSNPSDPARLQPLTHASRIRVTFNGSVSDVLAWRFAPQQREVRVVPGETALAFYTATNESTEDVIGVATYSVTPGQVAPYFSKIQCFCFEEQRLKAGETVDMPVFFYIDPEFARDPNMRGIEQKPDTTKKAISRQH